MSLEKASWSLSLISIVGVLYAVVTFIPSCIRITCGVPHGSILGPFFFFSTKQAPALPLRHNISFNVCADNMQLYIPLTPADSDSLVALKDCFEEMLYCITTMHLLL